MDKDLIEKTAKSLKEDPRIVRDSIDIVERYISSRIRSGEMENVRIPLLGVFKVNLKKLKYLTQVKPSPKVKLVRGFPESNTTP